MITSRVKLGTLNNDLRIKDIFINFLTGIKWQFYRKILCYTFYVLSYDFFMYFILTSVYFVDVSLFFVLFNK